MKRTVLFLWIGVGWVALSGSGAQASIRSSTVKVFTIFKRPDYEQPWQMHPQRSRTGSGCVVGENRILTNAHVVGDQVYLQVRKAGRPEKFTAELEFVAHDCELALLRVSDSSFFKDTSPIPLGDLPAQGDRVTAYGFPLGGDELSITKGVVSRIEVTEYVHSGRSFLTVQTDAAINPGNSGGPVIQNDRLAGISFQSFSGSQAENIGYMVPAPIIRRFLEDIRDGRYDGIGSLGIFWQKTENESLRNQLQLSPAQSGVLVTRTRYGSSVWGLLQEGDVLVSFGGKSVAGDGTTVQRLGERVHFSHLLSSYQLGQQVPAEISRQGRLQKILVPLEHETRLVPGPRYDVRPTYFIFAGLVFVPLTRDYMGTWEWQNVPEIFKYYFFHGLPSQERKEVVVLSKVLPQEVNVGYHEVTDVIVRSVNGRNISQMRDLAEAFRHPQGNYQVVDLEAHATFGTRIVLDASQAQKAHGEILSRYGIAGDRSEDLAR
ncbi:MAG: trypsin-like peptidase domain-containing protein [Elusimicrobia bacterium]|nr:trypsin-like peptidase domain-containing protein [Elusimicrobiota bacterium]